MKERRPEIIKFMNELKEIFKQLQNEQIGRLDFEQEADKGKYYSKKIHDIFSKLLEDCKSGKKIPVEEIKELLDIKTIEIRSRYKNMPNLKMISLYFLLDPFYGKINRLKFEIAKREKGVNEPLCYCSLRLSNNIGPDSKYIVRYGRAILYHENDEHIIVACKLCGTKWIQDIPHGMVSASNRWTVWDPDGDYLLRNVFEK